VFKYFFSNFFYCHFQPFLDYFYFHLNLIMFLKQSTLFLNLFFYLPLQIHLLPLHFLLKLNIFFSFHFLARISKNPLLKNHSLELSNLLSSHLYFIILIFPYYSYKPILLSISLILYSKYFSMNLLLLTFYLSFF
jgi:hypothetical protein